MPAPLLGSELVSSVPEPLPRRRPADSWFPRSGYRQPEDEARARLAAGLQAQAATVPLGDVPGDGQAQPRTPAPGRPRVVQPGEPLEYPLTVLRRDPRAVVDDD